MKKNHEQVPFVLQLGFALTLFNSWVLFEETVVDRLGWWQYMACYRVGRFCEWDVGALIVILTVWLIAFSSARARVFTGLRRGCAAFGCRTCRAP